MFSNMTRSKIQSHKCRQVAPTFSLGLGVKLRELQGVKTSTGIPGKHQEDETVDRGRGTGSGDPLKKVPRPNDVA
jgi:hypothetical protein